MCIDIIQTFHYCMFELKRVDCIMFFPTLHILEVLFKITTNDNFYLKHFLDKIHLKKD